MNINTEATDDFVLALFWLTLHDDHRAWKGFAPDVLNRFYGRGFIGDPVNKAKSVVLTEKGLTTFSGDILSLKAVRIMMKRVSDA